MLGFWQVEEVPGSGFRVAGVGELDLLAVGLEAERERGLPAGAGLAPAVKASVSRGLFLDALEGMVGAFCFNNAAGFGVEIKNIVRASGVA